MVRGSTLFHRAVVNLHTSVTAVYQNQKTIDRNSDDCGYLGVGVLGDAGQHHWCV